MLSRFQPIMVVLSLYSQVYFHYGYQTWITWEGGGRKPASKQLLCCKEPRAHTLLAAFFTQGPLHVSPAEPDLLSDHLARSRNEYPLHGYGLQMGVGWAAESLAQKHLKVAQAHRAMTVPLPELKSHATIEWLWVVPGFGLETIEAPIRFKPWLFHCQKQNWTAMVEG